ncbi:MAG TPA: nucleoside-diphosphate kinase, partial [Acidobacteria bacterium]|nr:nucleoside-diphosphate kinase [Acidobacteriota bacterium]
MTERTLTIIKPDSVEKNNVGAIIAHLEREGFRIVAARMMRLTEAQARAFYEVHKERPFYDDLVAYMTSGPVWPMCLEREDAV